MDRDEAVVGCSQPQPADQPLSIAFLSRNSPPRQRFTLHVLQVQNLSPQQLTSGPPPSIGPSEIWHIHADMFLSRRWYVFRRLERRRQDWSVAASGSNGGSSRKGGGLAQRRGGAGRQRRVTSHQTQTHFRLAPFSTLRAWCRRKSTCCVRSASSTTPGSSGRAIPLRVGVRGMKLSLLLGDETLRICSR